VASLAPPAASMSSGASIHLQNCHGFVFFRYEFWLNDTSYTTAKCLKELGTRWHNF